MKHDERVDGFGISRWFSFAMVGAIMSAIPDPVEFNPPSHCPKRLQGRRSEQKSDHAWLWNLQHLDSTECG
jgi:hypothetical protein